MQQNSPNNNPASNSVHPNNGDVFDLPVDQWPHDLQMEYNLYLSQIINSYPNRPDEAHKMALFGMRTKHPELSKERERKRFADALDKAMKELLVVPKSELVSEIGKYSRKLFRMVIGWRIESPDKVLNEFLPFAQKFDVATDDITNAVYSAYKSAQRNPAKALATGNPVKVYDETGRGLYGALRNAEVFLQAHVDNLRYVAAQDKWLIYNDGVWEEDNVLEHEYLAWQVCLQMAGAELEPSKRHSLVQYSIVNSMLRASRSDKRFMATMGQWDNDSWLLSSGSNVIDLRTGESRNAVQEDYITKQASTMPVSGVVPTKWLQFLHDETNCNQELIDYLQLLCGYCLTGSTREHQFFFLYGTGRNGKSVFLNVLRSLLSDYTKGIPESVLMAQKHPGHRETLARLQGARIVITSELKQGASWNEALLKQMVGGDVITANHMHQNSFDYLPQFKLLIAGNHKPGLHEFEEAMRRRLRLIPFSVTISKDKCIPNLDQMLIEEEGGAILAWMVEGCMKWQALKDKGGLDAALPAVVKQATEEYFDSEDPLTQFLGEEFDIDYSTWTSSKNVYFIYCQWANENGIKFQWTRKTLIQRLKEKGFQERHNEYGTAVYGLKKKNSWGLEQARATAPFITVSSDVPFGGA
jgi:P4 family phage/plasmid primase-like protien